jgi:hypothetical protein
MQGMANNLLNPDMFDVLSRWQENWSTSQQQACFDRFGDQDQLFHYCAPYVITRIYKKPIYVCS